MPKRSETSVSSRFELKTHGSSRFELKTRGEYIHDTCTRGGLFFFLLLKACLNDGI